MKTFEIKAIGKMGETISYRIEAPGKYSALRAFYKIIGYYEIKDFKEVKKNEK